MTEQVEQHRQRHESQEAAAENRRQAVEKPPSMVNCHSTSSVKARCCNMRRGGRALGEALPVFIDFPWDGCNRRNETTEQDEKRQRRTIAKMWSNHRQREFFLSVISFGLRLL